MQQYSQSSNQHHPPLLAMPPTTAQQNLAGVADMLLMPQPEHSCWIAFLADLLFNIFHEKILLSSARVYHFIAGPIGIAGL